MSAAEAHVHQWQPNGTATEDQVSYSPVSQLDHCVRTITYAIQSCSCGKVRRVAVGAGPWRWLLKRAVAGDGQP